MDELTVRLGERSYRIRFGSGILSTLGSMCRELELGGKVAVVTNPTVGKYYLEPVRASLAVAGFEVHPVEIPDGENHKSGRTLDRIYDALIEGGLNRQSFIVALGGGVVGDMAGYAAATYLRGIPFVQAPTTLLAQVDSSVGGKTGINHPLGKNLIGAFHQPRLVVIDPDTLDTLPEREYLSGMAEVVKYGAVCGAPFFDFLAAESSRLLARDKDILLSAIRTSCALKAAVVERDEREGGHRAVLNYGHTFAHAVESLTGYSKYLHGEAVAMGMARAARLSEAKGYARPEDTVRIIGLLASLRLPTELPAFQADEYRQAMLRDKKVRDGGINFVFNNGIGDSIVEKVSDWGFLLRDIPR